MAKRRNRRHNQGPVTPASTAVPARAVRLERILPWLLAAVTVIVFAQQSRFDFVHWDDHTYVFENPLLRPVTWDTLRQFWLKDYRGFYNPVTMSTYAVEALLFGLNGGLFHIVNLLVHVANVVLVYAIIRRLLVARSTDEPALLAAAGALLFAVHPTRVETVAWITGMKDLLSTFFSLLAVYAYFGRTGAPVGRARFWPRGTEWFVLALLAKPSIAVLGPVVFVLDAALCRTPWRTALLRVWPWFVLAVPIALVTRQAQPASMVTDIPPVWFRLFVAADAIQFYIVKVLAPVGLTPMYARTPAWLAAAGAWRWTWIVPAALAAVAGWAAWRRRFAPLGLLVAFALALFPVLGLVPFLTQNLSTVADHYFYFPFLIVALALGLIVAELPAAYRRAAMGGVVLVCAVFAALTFAYLPTWRNDDTLLRYAIERAPRTALLRMNYSESLYERRQYEASLEQLREAAKIESHADIYNNIGSVLVKLGRFDEAVTAFERALALNPLDPEIAGNLARIRGR